MKATPEPAAAKQKHKAGKKAKPAKKAGRAKKAAGKPKADRANKKAEVIAMMKRAKGATLPKIMKATDWQPHTVRGFFDSIFSPPLSISMTNGNLPELNTRFQC